MRSWIPFVVLALAASCGPTPQPSEPGATLTRQDPEPAGANCAYGGTAVRIGVDDNGDGVLEDNEIDSTQYVCNPSQAELTRMDPIPPGAQCAEGGTQISVGVDDNGDGILEDNEVDQVTIVCTLAEVWDGDFTAYDWSDPAKVTALEAAHVVTGSLTIDPDGSVSLPLLELVNGNVSIGGNVTDVDVPALRQIGGSLAVDAQDAPVLSLPALQRVVGDVAMTRYGNPGTSFTAAALVEIDGGLSFALTTGHVSFPSLTTIHGRLDLDGQLSAFDAPALATVGGKLTMQDGKLSSVALPALTTVGGDVVLDATPLQSVQLDALTDVTGAFQLYGGPQVAMLSLPALAHAGRVSVLANSALTTLWLPALAHVDQSVSISDDANLASIDLRSLASTGPDPSVPTNTIFIDQVAVTELDFPALTSADGWIGIDEDHALERVTFDTLDGAATDLEISDAPALIAVSAPAAKKLMAVGIYWGGHVEVSFPQLTTLTGTLELQEEQVDDLSGFAALSSVHELVLDHVAGLRDLTGLASLTQVDNLDLNGDADLATLAGLEGITHLTGWLQMTGFSDAFTDASGLRNLEYVGRYVQFGPTFQLTALRFDHLTSVTGDLAISDQYALTSLGGLAALQSVGGNLYLSGLDKVPPAEITALKQRLGK
jgi:hypothetical protein